MKIKANIWIFLIIILASILRFYQLSSNPPSLTPDEAALGYNAYSILKTGRDEYGEFLPIVFKSFGDYKPGLYIYASILPIAVFGLTEFAVRFASAASGVIAVYLVYLIIKNFKEIDSNRFKSFGVNVEVITALLLAISPWHIHFSRGAWEVNFALTLILMGIYLFMKSFIRNNLLILSAVFFGLSLLAYQGAKMSSGVVLIIMIVVFYKKLLKFDKKSLVVSTIVGLIISIPIILSFFSGQTGRLKVFSVFSYKRSPEFVSEHLENAQVLFGSPQHYLFYSENLNTFQGIMGRWFNHFSLRFLLFEGDWSNPRHSSPDHGQILIADFVFLIIGIYILIKHWNTKYAKFALLWLVLAPLPSALSRDQVHAVRALNMVIPLILIIGSGLAFTITRLRKTKVIGKLLISIIIIIYVGSLVSYLDSYYVHQPKHNSQFWEYGYKQAVQAVLEVKDGYDRVHVRQSFAQPYIYFLFYGKVNPSEYQQEAYLIESEYGDVGRVERAAGIDFLPIDWTINRGESGTLFVADPMRIPPKDSTDPNEFDVLKEIYFLDGKEISMRLIGVKHKNGNNQ